MVALYEILCETLSRRQKHPTNTPNSQQPFVTSTMVENIEYDIGAIAN
jgi:hypothetical protein